MEKKRKENGNEGKNSKNKKQKKLISLFSSSDDDDEEEEKKIYVASPLIAIDDMVPKFNEDDHFDKINLIKSKIPKKGTIKIIEDLQAVKTIKRTPKKSNNRINSLFINLNKKKFDIEKSISFFNEQHKIRNEFLNSLNKIINKEIKIKNENWNKKFDKIKTRLTTKSKLNELKQENKKSLTSDSDSLLKINEYELINKMENKQIELMNIVNYIIKFIENDSKKTKNQLNDSDKFKNVINNFTNDTLIELNSILEENALFKNQLNLLNSNLLIEKSKSLNEKILENENKLPLKSNLFNLHRIKKSTPIKKVFKKKNKKNVNSSLATKK